MTMPMLPDQIDAGDRKAQLRQRCESERQKLGAQMAVIEQRLQQGDALFNSVKSFVSRPVVLAAGAAMLLLRRGKGMWGLLSRGALLFATARRVYRLVKR